MKKMLWIAPLVAVGAMLLVWTSQPSIAQTKSKGVDANKCFACHSEVKDLYSKSKHGSLSCETCHSGMDAHMKNPQTKPVTDLDISTCGSCHADQHDSFWRAGKREIRSDKGQFTGRSPAQDKLLAPHGFTKEHNEPRAHAFMTIDQFVVDRFAGGRYEYKDMISQTRPGKVWDLIVDTGKTRPETAQAGNPVCVQCKTSDTILKWKFMGDPDPRAKWDRTSNLHEFIKDVQQPMGCIHCHDPHGTKPRIVRDGLIQAIERDGAAPYAADKGKDMVEKVVTFRDFRKIALLNGAKSNLMCGQCHVEYNCNPGFNPQTGEKFTMASQLANHFPWKTPDDLIAHYKTIGFADFRHAVTGAALTKMQHPELESYWGSKHERAGVQCHQCHMPQEKNKKGKTFTSHAVVKPSYNVETTCLTCHPDWKAEEAKLIVNGVKNYTKNKMRKAESGLLQLIDTFAKAKSAGVSEEVLNQARNEHTTAHLLWEWWTAENSDGWHNPELARQNLVDSLLASKRGMEILNKAMAEKK